MDSHRSLDRLGSPLDSGCPHAPLTPHGRAHTPHMVHQTVSSSMSSALLSLPPHLLPLVFQSLRSSFISQNLAGCHAPQGLSTCCSSCLEHPSPITSSTGQVPLILLGMSASLSGPVMSPWAVDQSPAWAAHLMGGEGSHKAEPPCEVSPGARPCPRHSAPTNTPAQAL